MQLFWNLFLFQSLLPRTDSFNEGGGRAYKFTLKHALAQMAATGCFNGVYYASAQSQLDEMRQLIDQVDDNVFLAKLAAYVGQFASANEYAARPDTGPRSTASLTSPYASAII